jgi:DNA-binding Lrp family transcriptional regulator
MSPPAIADRLARLERAGVIRGYRVDIDWAALGYPVVVYLAVTAGPGMDLSQIIRATRPGRSPGTARPGCGTARPPRAPGQSEPLPT